VSVLTAPEIILRPVISEKSIDESSRGKYTFAVHPEANKIQIKAAVEELYKKEGVRVVSVNVLTTQAKEKRRGTRRGRIVGRTTPWRKAIVTLAPGLRGQERRRLLDLGLLPGTKVTAEVRSPSGDPTGYRIRGATVALRAEQASLIKVRPVTVEEARHE